MMSSTKNKIQRAGIKVSDEPGTIHGGGRKRSRTGQTCTGHNLGQYDWAGTGII